MEISQYIHLLGDQLGKVISELESPAIYETEEGIRTEAKARRAGDESAAKRLRQQVEVLSADEARAVAAAFATYFDLVNLAEENYRLAILRKQEAENAPAPLRESIGEAVAVLKRRGVTREQMDATLRDEEDVRLLRVDHDEIVALHVRALKARLALKAKKQARNLRRQTDSMDRADDMADDE